MRPTPDKLIADYKRDCKRQGLADVTITARMSNLRNFNKFVSASGIHLLDVEKDAIRDWLDELKTNRRSFDTRRNNLSTLSSFFDYLIYEELIDINPVLVVRKRYLKSYKEGNQRHTHKIVTVEEMSRLIRSAVDIRDRCLMLILAKTGVRRNELISMDVSDIRFEDQSIILKVTPKRSNRLVFFDNETETLLKRWLKVRLGRDKWNDNALFLSQRSSRLEKFGVDRIIDVHATRLGISDPQSKKLEDHFTSHCFRHFFTTHLIRAGMPRDFVKELRGDSRREAIDIYNHIDKKELKEAYLACIPQLGI